MQLAINIQNESIADKVLWMLKHFVKSWDSLSFITHQEVL